MQLDLFAHALDVMLRNDVIAALRGRDGVAGAKALARLCADYPHDRLIEPLAALLHALVAPAERYSDHDETAGAVRTMDTVVVPAANQVFGASEARGWLAPVWRSLASSAAGLSYDDRKPYTHAAFMLLRSGDWAAAQARVAAIASWRRIPAALAWMAEARFGEGGLEAAWCLLAELAWIDAAAFGALARRLEAPPLRGLLDGFDAAFEAGDEAELAWFPAWALIAEPGLAAMLRQTQPCNHTGPERAARLVMEILTLERQGRHADLIAQRKKLRDLHTGLFSHYMSTR